MRSFDWTITTAPGPELRTLLPGAVDWLSRSRLAARTPGIADALVDALLGGAAWLDHPVLAPISLEVDDARLDLQLIWWIADHAGIDAPALPRPETDTWLFRSGGLEPVAAGQAYAPPGAGARTIRVDPWWECLGAPGVARLDLPREWSWAASPPVDEAETAALAGHVAAFGTTIAWFKQALPAAYRWTRSVTKLVLPYRPGDGRRFRSASRTDLPGAIFLDISVPAPLLLEGLVHESAHRHFFRWEAEGPLVDPKHGDRYRSPLRQDPRPLRGIYLAYHALTYMVLLYEALDAQGALPSGARELTDLRARARDAEAVLARARAHLTERGQALLAETVAAAGEPMAHV